MPKQSRASIAQETRTRAYIATPKPEDTAPIKIGRALLDAMQAGDYTLASQLRAEQKRANKRRAKDKKARLIAESGVAIVTVTPNGSKQSIARPLHRARIAMHDAIKARGMLGDDPLSREAIGLNDTSKARATMQAKRYGAMSAIKTRVAYDAARAAKKDTE